MLRSLLLVLAVLLGSAQCRSSGPPAGEVLVCEQITPGPPGHTADPQFGNGGHAIVTDLPLSAAGDFFEYQANVTYSGKQFVHTRIKKKKKEEVYSL